MDTQAPVYVQVAMVPVRVDEHLETHYLDIGRLRFDAPLFDDVVEEHEASSVLRLRVPLDDLIAASPPIDGPGGVVLHVGRSGSTLLCNLLTSVGGWVALKEPELLNDLLLRTERTHDDAERERLQSLSALLLAGLAHGVGSGADRRPRRCVVKLTSWNLLLVDDLLGRLPHVPLVVLTREPTDTVASLLQDPPQWYGAVKPARSSEAARVFADAWVRAVEQTLRLPAERTLVIDYADLVGQPRRTVERVLRHLGDETQVDPATVAKEVAGYSKEPGRPFEPAGRHRRERVDDATRELVSTITAQSWSALRQRIGGS